MSYRCSPLEIGRLQAIKTSYEDCLRTNPQDTTARVGLAWCLFLKALFQAGRESAPACASNRQGAEETGEARTLLAECLRYAEAAKHLSARPEDHQRVHNLYALVELLGGETAIAEARDMSEKILVQITRDVQQAANREPAHPQP